MNRRGRRVVVAGGGITGLVTAYRIALRAREVGRDVECVLLEAEGRLGGNIRTEREGPCVVDGGPDSFLIAKPHASALCRELGLGDRLVTTPAAHRRVLVAARGRLHPLPEGLLLTVPSRPLALARSRLLSSRGKLRALLDLVLPPRPVAAPEGDESIASLVRRRLGQEVLDTIAEPLLGGIYAGDVATLSVVSTFPRLAELEREHGSLIRGARSLGVPSRRGRAAGGGGGGEAPAAFHSLAGGLGELVDALAARLDPARVRRGARVEEVVAARDPSRGRFEVLLRGRDGARETLTCDDLVVATPAHAAAAQLRSLDPALAGRLGEIRYLSTATIVSAYARADVEHTLAATGVLFPRAGGSPLLAATFTTSKWPGRAPGDTVLLRAFVGGVRSAPLLDAPDAELVLAADRELRPLLGLRAAPLWARVFRFRDANPQPELGHAARLRSLALDLARHPGLHLAGSGYDGVGIPDCVRQAGEVADRIAAGWDT